MRDISFNTANSVISPRNAAIRELLVLELLLRSQVHPPTTKDISTSGDEYKIGQSGSNPYARFLRRPRRKVRREIILPVS